MTDSTVPARILTVGVATSVALGVVALVTARTAEDMQARAQLQLESATGVVANQTSVSTDSESVTRAELEAQYQQLLAQAAEQYRVQAQTMIDEIAAQSASSTPKSTTGGGTVSTRSSASPSSARGPGGSQQSTTTGGSSGAAVPVAPPPVTAPAPAAKPPAAVSRAS